MAKVLMPIGDATEVLDTLYPFFRLPEDGFEVVVAGPEARWYHGVMHEIPPGEKRYRSGSKITLPVDLTLTSVLPHMHLIGKEMKITATLPDGASKPLLWIKDWNFYWQDSYVYGDPVRLPKGTLLEIDAWYDNSADNPANPRTPPQRVL